MYAAGRGVPQDAVEAIRLWRLAAARGDAGAQANLGQMYYEGRGVPQDDAEAARWFRLAADQGHAGAQQLLASMDARGGREPTLQDALDVPAGGLSQGYRLMESYLDFLFTAEGGGTIQTPEGTIDKSNVQQYRERCEARLAIYRAAIEQRGYELFAGNYDASATESCSRAGSAWAGLVCEGAVRGVEIVQEGFAIQLTTRYEVDGEIQSIETQPVAVESVMTFDDFGNSDYSLVGEIEDGKIVVKPDDSVLDTWPQWADPPKREDLRNCTATLQVSSNEGGSRTAVSPSPAPTPRPNKTDTDDVGSLRLAAEQGDAETLHRAAEQGDAEAQIFLGEMFAEGRGVRQSNAEAARWYRRAADQGHADALNNLDRLYEEGPDVSQILRELADESARVAVIPLTGLRGYSGWASAAFSPDGTRLAMSSEGRTWVWPLDGSAEPVRLWGDISRSAAAFSPDGTRIVTYSDGVARIFETNGASEPVLLVHTYDRGGRAPVNMAAFSPDGSRILTTAHDYVRVWPADGIGEPVVLTADDIYTPDSKAMFSLDGTRVVTTYFDRSVRVWGLDGTSQSVIQTGYGGSIHSAALSPDGTRIVTTENQSKTAEVWWLDGEEEPVVLAGHTNAVNSAVFSPDGTRIVTASILYGTTRVWQADDTRKPPVVIGDGATAAAFSPDGLRIVTISGTRARVWQADGMGEPVLLSLPGPPRPGNTVNSAVFSPDGTRVVTTSRDLTVRVWRWMLVEQ